MDDDNEALSSPPAPRRSQREKKIAKPYYSIESIGSKRKRKDSDSELEPEESDGEGLASGAEDEDDEGQQEEELEEEYRASKATTGTTANGKSKPKAAKKNSVPATKKARTAKGAAIPKATTTKPARKGGRKPKVTPGEFDIEKAAGDTKIATDNPLFNALINPTVSVKSTAEDFLESLGQSAASAQAELINCVLRCCGSNDSVNADEVVDYDGVVDALDNFTEALKNDDSPIYPLTSKLPLFKKFRPNLSTFLSSLILGASSLGLLYSSELMTTLQTWLVAMSSSQIRSFRHTATVIALELEVGLCEVAGALEKEGEMVNRQREGEKKRNAGRGKTDKSGKAGARLRELEGKAEEVRERKSQLAEYLKEFVDGVFVHRYRDLDPSIRTECVRSLGLWFLKHPTHFLDSSYLRYIGWVLSDSSTSVRLEAARTLLTSVYTQQAYLTSLHHFTERFKPRLVEMAEGDTEVTVRVAVLGVLELIERGLGDVIGEGERERLCLLVFDEEAKVRRAVGGFVRAVWEEKVEERLVGRGAEGSSDKRKGVGAKKGSSRDKGAEEEERKKAGVKAFAELLVKWGKELDKKAGDSTEDEEGPAMNGSSMSSDLPESSDRNHRRTRRRKENVAASITQGQREKRTRIALAVEALWDEVGPASDWEGLLEVLLLDHSASIEDDGESGSRGGKKRAVGTERRKGKGVALDDDEGGVDEAWRLEEVEEGVLLEVLIATIARARPEVSGGKKGEEEIVTNDITRALIKALPQLFIKHQTDQNRIADVLRLPVLMNLDLYLEMRMLTAYASLWDDITKQFLTHSSPLVLTSAVRTLRTLLDTPSLANTNSTKILELEDELSTALREAVSNHADEIEVSVFNEDEVLGLEGLCARLSALMGVRDMCAWVEEDEGGKMSSVWEIVSSLVDRGRLGYKEEETMVEHALQFLTLHVVWKARSLPQDVDLNAEEEQYKQKLKEQRDALLEKLTEFAVGTRSNTIEGVKGAAFQSLINLHILFSPPEKELASGKTVPTASVALRLDDETQFRCAGFVQTEIERYGEEGGFIADDEDDEEQDSSEEDSDEENEAAKVKRRKAKANKNKPGESNPRARLEREYVFMGVISTFLRAIRGGVINIRHGAVFLAHFGRLGPSFDLCSKVIVDVLREEGMFNDQGDVVVNVITQAIQEAYLLVFDGLVRSETNCVALAKLLSSCMLIRGAQLSIVRRLDVKYVIEIHSALLTWIGKRLAMYEKNKNKKGKNVAIAFFRVLLPLLVPIESKDAAKIKEHMDLVLEQAKVEIPPTSKLWDPQRSYEKRLSKEKGPTTKKKGTKGAKSGDEAEHTEGENIAEEAVPRPKPRPVRSTRKKSSKPVVQDGSEEEQDLVAQPLTPKPRPRARPMYRKKSTPRKPVLDSSPPTSPVSRVDSEPNGDLTPKSTRKRLLPDETEENSKDAVGDHLLDNGPSTPRQLTPPSEIVPKRKRARH